MAASWLVAFGAAGGGQAAVSALGRPTGEAAPLSPHRLIIHRHINVTIRPVAHPAMALEAASQDQAATASPRLSPDDALAQRNGSCCFEAGVDYDRGGGRRAHATGVASKEACCALCKERPSCGVATYLAVSQQCWFKPLLATRRPSQSSAGVVSCILTEREPNESRVPKSHMPVRDEEQNCSCADIFGQGMGKSGTSIVAVSVAAILSLTSTADFTASVTIDPLFRPNHAAQLALNADLQKWPSVTQHHAAICGALNGSTGSDPLKRTHGTPTFKLHVVKGFQYTFVTKFCPASKAYLLVRGPLGSARSIMDRATMTTAHVPFDNLTFSNIRATCLSIKHRLTRGWCTGRLQTRSEGFTGAYIVGSVVHQWLAEIARFQNSIWRLPRLKYEEWKTSPFNASRTLVQQLGFGRASQMAARAEATFSKRILTTQAQPKGQRSHLSFLSIFGHAACAEALSPAVLAVAWQLGYAHSVTNCTEQSVS